MAENPFTPIVAALALAPPDPGNEAETVWRDAVTSADKLWTALDALPSKAEATLAQRRLQEAMFWAGQSVFTFVRSGG